MKTPEENILEFRNAFITTSFLDLNTKMIVIKLNIVTIAPFCFPRSRLYDSVIKRVHEQNFIVFFVAPKNAYRGTLDSKTQTKKRKWVSFQLLKFILGSAAEGNKTKEINYSTLNLHAISFLLYPQPRHQVWIFINGNYPSIPCVELAYSQASFFLFKDRPVPL